ncbi:DUF4862 family protein [Nocardia sp. SYP-A9097]|nr:DUF4862 family protein [Nocardia sp. SYP-A9097]
MITGMITTPAGGPLKRIADNGRPMVRLFCAPQNTMTIRSARSKRSARESSWVMVNWGRSVAQQRDPDAAATQVRVAGAAGVLAAVTFSGCAPVDTLYGRAWDDTHVPPSPVCPGSLLTPDRIAATLRAIGPGPVLRGLEVSAPRGADVRTRLAMVARSLAVLRSAARAQHLEHPAGLVVRAQLIRVEGHRQADRVAGERDQSFDPAGTDRLARVVARATGVGVHEVDAGPGRDPGDHAVQFEELAAQPHRVGIGDGDGGEAAAGAADALEIVEQHDAGVWGALTNTGDGGGHAWFGARDVLRHLIQAVDDQLVQTRGRGRIGGDAGAHGGGQFGVIAADLEGDQVGGGGQAVELRRVGADRGGLRGGHIRGDRAAAGGVPEDRRGQRRRDLLGVVVCALHTIHRCEGGGDLAQCGIGCP